jgi:DNA-binding NarL/FixJ family response regulator
LLNFQRDDPGKKIWAVARYSLHLIARSLPPVEDDGTVAKRIMVVDDNPAIRKILRNILEFDCDWTVCGEGVDGRDGVEKAKDLKPDLIVLDVSMPVMNGLEAARILHQIMPNVPVILCSLHTDRMLELEARGAGVTAVFSKAENMQTLISKARELLKTA